MGVAAASVVLGFGAGVKDDMGRFRATIETLILLLVGVLLAVVTNMGDFEACKVLGLANWSSLDMETVLPEVEVGVRPLEAEGDSRCLAVIAGMRSVRRRLCEEDVANIDCVIKSEPDVMKKTVEKKGVVPMNERTNGAKMIRPEEND